MSFGLVELAVIVGIGWIVGWAIPVVILLAMANSKGRSRHFAWWALGGWVGFLIAAIIIAAGRPYIAPPQDVD